MECISRHLLCLPSNRDYLYLKPSKRPVLGLTSLLCSNRLTIMRMFSTYQCRLLITSQLLEADLLSISIQIIIPVFLSEATCTLSIVGFKQPCFTELPVLHKSYKGTVRIYCHLVTFHPNHHMGVAL